MINLHFNIISFGMIKEEQEVSSLKSNDFWPIQVLNPLQPQIIQNTIVFNNGVTLVFDKKLEFDKQQGLISNYKDVNLTSILQDGKNIFLGVSSLNTDSCPAEVQYLSFFQNGEIPDNTHFVWPMLSLTSMTFLATKQPLQIKNFKNDFNQLLQEAGLAKYDHLKSIYKKEEEEDKKSSLKLNYTHEEPNRFISLWRKIWGENHEDLEADSTHSGSNTLILRRICIVLAGIGLVSLASYWGYKELSKKDAISTEIENT